MKQKVARLLNKSPDQKYIFILGNKKGQKLDAISQVFLLVFSHQN